MKIISSAWIKAVIGLVLLILIINFVDSDKALLSLKHMHIKWLFYIIACIMCATFIGAFSAYLLMNRKGNIKWSLFLPIYWLAWAFSLVTPGQIGDIATITSLLKKQNIDWHLSLGRSLLDKLISFVIMTSLAITGLYITSIQHLNYERFNTVYYSLIPLSGMVIYLFHSRIYYFFSPSHSGIRGLIGKTFLEAKLTVKLHFTKVITNIILTSIKILLIGVAYWCMFRALGGDINLLEVVLLVPASALIAYLPISFNGIGTVEVTAVYLFNNIGLSTTTIITSYLILRIIVLLIAWIPAGIWIVVRTYNVESEN